MLYFILYLCLFDLLSCKCMAFCLEGNEEGNFFLYFFLIYNDCADYPFVLF